MTEQDVLIYFIKVGIPVVTFLFGIFKGVTTPVNELKAEIIKLESSLNNVKEHNGTQDTRIDKHSEEIDSHSRTLENHDTRISNLENRECKYEIHQKLKRGE